MVRDGRAIINRISWQVRPGQHWVVIGPNGGGKSTLLGVAGLRVHPSSGTVTVLGHQLGKVDIRGLRRRIGTSSAGLAQSLRSTLSANEIVECGLYGALEPWWHTYTEADRDRSNELLAWLRLRGFGSREFGTLSSGERQRVLIARALMAKPDVLLLDEPTSGLDLGGREGLLEAIDRLAASSSAPPTVFVCHRVEDIPSSSTHLLAIAAGSAVASGEIHSTLSGELISKVFGVDVDLDFTSGRWSARSTRSSR